MVGCDRSVKFVATARLLIPKSPHGKVVELAHDFEPIQDGRIYIEKINGPMLFELKATPSEYSAGLKLAIEQ
jgi:hypothetical protein